MSTLKTLCVSIAALLPAMAWAQEPAKPAAVGGAEAEIRAASAAYAKAYAAGDAKAIAEMYSEDGELVDTEGRIFQGREQIEQEFAAIFAGQAGAQVDVKIESIKFLSPDVALETGTAQARSKTASAGGPVKYSALLVKRDGRWQLMYVTEMRPAATDAAGQLSALGFLVGDWRAELGEGKSYQSHCGWMSGDRFLSRTFTVLDKGQPVNSGTQIIGFDPILGQIVSWTFDASGGFSHEIWEEQGAGWRIASASVLPDGSTSLSTNYLTRGDANSFTWQSTERSLNDQLLPDTKLVRIARAAK